MNKKNNSYRINRCTYGQKNFFLSNFLTLINSFCYLILLSYYLIILRTYKIDQMTMTHHQELYQKSLTNGRRKSAERHKQHMLVINLKQFLTLIIYSHTFLTFLRLIYICLLISILSFSQRPFLWLKLKLIFYFFFLIGYISIPLRMMILFIYLFYKSFSPHIHSILLYLFHTNLRFSWKLQKPSICFRFEFVPYSIQDEHLTNSLGIDISSSVEEDQSNIIQHESIVIYDESSTNYHGTSINILSTPSVASE